MIDATRRRRPVRLSGAGCARGRAGTAWAWPVAAFVTLMAAAIGGAPGALASDPVPAPESESPAPASSASPAGTASSASQAAPAAPAAPAAQAGAGSAAKPISTPWARRYVLPDPDLTAVAGVTEPPPWEPSKWRFTVVATLASWNPASAPMIEWMGEIAAEFAARRVLVLGAFSHDTAASLARFAKGTRPRFPAGLASEAFLKERGNPKVPTVWVVDPRGEIVARKELPSEEERKRLRDRLRLWTDF